MPRPDGRFGPGGPGGQGGPPQDPALVLAQLKNNRAQLAASIPSDENFAAAQAAGAELAVAQRTAAQERLVALDEAIEQLENNPPQEQS